MIIRKRTARPAQHLDVTGLPEDLVALIDALEPGESLDITRDGASIATISSTVDVIQGAVVDRDEPAGEPGQEPVDHESMTVVATAMDLSAAARVALSTQLGADYVVLDMHAAPATADVLLVPPASPQLIGRLRMLFPKARVIVTEIEDEELGVQYHGPVRRLLDAGAEAYLPPASVPQLARQLEYTLGQGRELAGGPAAPLPIAPAGPGDE
ncbi:hypothetical protein [Nonomuraea rubra]|uniref:Uncharacterized protein n=1 Tax=Nonomuraea rubra TaxID=46180 RepID=A0A7X0U0I4_9ACTN|nr:hypothetical protein [Nonomuraea rubra]MBB6550588.1 hypothetical protein [Nonomuraea rubra]